MTHATTERFRSPALAVHTVDCREENRAFGAEEHAGGHQIVLVRGGAWELCLGRTSHFLDPTSAVVLRRGDAYRVRHPLRGGDRCTVIGLGASTVRDMLARLDWARAGGADRLAGPRVLSAEPRTALVARALLRHLDGGADPCAAEETALALAASVLRSSARAPEPRRASLRAATARAHAELVDAVRRVLAARFRERLLLSDVARAVLWSPYHMARVFRGATGRPVHRHLVRLRLAHALEQVCERRACITDVALEAGFASHAHLCAAFRAELGLPPSALRRVGARDLREMSKILKA